VLGAVRLGWESLTGDEASVYFASQRWGLWHVLGDRMPLHTLLLRGWVAVFGSGEAALRSLSLVFAVASVPVLFLVARRLVGQTAAVIATGLFAVNTLVVVEAQAVRSSTLLVFCCLAASYCFLRAVEERSGAWFALYGLAGVLAVCAHFFALWVLAAHALSCLALRRDERPLRALAAVYACVAAPAVVLAAAASGTDGLDSGVAGLTPSRVVFVLDRVSGARERYTLPPFVLLVGLALLGLVRGGRTWRQAVVWAWIAVPVAGSLVASVAVSTYTEHLLVVIVPAVAMAVAVGLTSVHRRALAVAAGVAIAAFAAASLSIMLAERDNEDWRRATAIVLAGARQGDALVVNAPSGFDYYARGDARAGRLRRAEADTVSAPRVWLLFRGEAKDHRRVRAQLEAASYREAAELDVERLELDLLKR
jgi:mannosyltransferase